MLMAEKLIQKVELKERKTYAEFIKEIGLDDKYHAVLVNGCKVTDVENTILDTNSKIVILPRIRGG